MFYVVRWGDTPDKDVIIGEFDDYNAASVMWSEMQDLDPGQMFVVRTKEEHEKIVGGGPDISVLTDQVDGAYADWDDFDDDPYWDEQKY